MTGTIDAAGAAARSGRVRATSVEGNEQISQVPYLPGLDGLRALAVVAVMIYHANSDWLAGGYLGVEVFFVISGYLITLLLIAEHERSGAIDLKGFWIRRFRRLLPALFLMMLLLSVWVSLFERDALGKLRGDVIAGSSYFSNWYQIWVGAGYSAGADFAPLRHLWSLAVEEQFYVVWPLVMLAFVKFGSRGIAGVARWLFLGSVAITLIVAFLNHGGPQQSPELTPDAYWMLGERPISKPDALYLSTFSRAGGLMLGSAFAMVWRPAAVMRGPLRTKAKLFDGVAGLGVGVLALMCWTVSFDPAGGVDGFLFKGGLFVTGLATLAIIAAITHRGANTGRLLSLPLLLWIGTRSYGLYLYHWPIYQIIRNIAANKLRFHEFVLAMVATAIITELSYRYVETPIRKGRLSELWRGRGAFGGRRRLSDGQRMGVVAGVAVAAGLTVFAGTSMATAELKQNELAQNLEAADEFVCDTLRDIDCDGVLDLDENGNPIAAGDEAVDGGTAGDGGTPVGDGTATSEVVGDAEAASTDDDPATESVATDVVVDSTTTTAPPASGMIAIGDSVMKGAASQLSALGFQVDAEESRAWINGLDYVQRLGAQGRLPQTMLIHLGTNGPISQNDMDRMMVAVADVPQVVLMTNDVDRSYTAGNNALIIDAASRFANVEYVDWQGLSNDCPGDCFYEDGYHLKPDGQEYYADVVEYTINN